MLALCQMLQEFTDNFPYEGPEPPPKIELSMGVHTTAAQVRACGV